MSTPERMRSSYRPTQGGDMYQSAMNTGRFGEPNGVNKDKIIQKCEELERNLV
jgi:hypothetical protein